MESEMHGPPSLDDGSVYIDGLRRSGRLKRKQTPIEPPKKKPKKPIEEKEPTSPIPCKRPSFVCSTPFKDREPFPDSDSSDEDSAEDIIEDLHISSSSTEEGTSYLVASRSGYEGHIFSESR
ncbi:uncharacterized protein [Drosophila kikkawai]|nr:uncharacterized protein LOC108080778 isoform X2 [Drosophila kikkawai]